MLIVRSVVVGPFTMNAYLAACSETGEARPSSSTLAPNCRACWRSESPRGSR